MEKIDKKDNQDNSIIEGPKGKIKLYHKLVEYNNKSSGGYRLPSFVQIDLIFKMSKNKQLDLGIEDGGCFRVYFDDEIDSKYQEEYPWDMWNLCKCYNAGIKYLNLNGAKCIFVKDIK
jgi:hypothetical protein